MDSIGDKADYVRSQRGRPARGHTCHWPGCTKEVPAAMWGCFPHWRALPNSLRTKIWNAYRPGQEITKTPSREYIEVAREVEEFARKEVLRLRGWEYDL